MPTIEFLPDKKTVEVPSGTPLSDAAHEAAINLETPCGGEGTCGRCLARVTRGEVGAESVGFLPVRALKEGYVLACRTCVQDSPLVVEIPEQMSAQSGQFVELAPGLLSAHGLLKASESVAPLTTKKVVSVPPPQLEDGLSDVDRLVRALSRESEMGHAIPSLTVMRTTADDVRAADGLVTITAHADHQQWRINKIESGDRLDRHFGLAIDIGTTTVSVGLIDFVRGELLATRSDYNEQLSCGLDVISRINYAAHVTRLNELQTRVLGTINHLVSDAAPSVGVNPFEISSAVISGNTVMTHLILGLKPEYLRLEPYTSTVLQLPSLTAREAGIEIHPGAVLQFSPCVGSYLGGDITAGLLMTDLVRDSEGVSLFIDIGTNGELVIGNNEFLMGCACSAGPAFEGGGIECGMRATKGAIDAVVVDPQTGAPTLSVLGDGKPIGICGSGMIELLASLLSSGWIDRAGKLDRTRGSPFIDTSRKRAHYLLASAEDSGTDKSIAIDEAEIENIIRAKAAIYSAAGLMLQQVDMTFSELEQIYIAGGFGRFLDLEKATTIGLLPDVAREKFTYLGNASLLGSIKAASSRAARARQRELAQRLTYFELSTEPQYMDQYTAALFCRTPISRSFRLWLRWMRRVEAFIKAGEIILLLLLAASPQA